MFNGIVFELTLPVNNAIPNLITNSYNFWNITIVFPLFMCIEIFPQLIDHHLKFETFFV